MNASSDRSEEARVSALRAYAILDTPPEEEFDGLARLAAQVCAAPMAIVAYAGEGEIAREPINLSKLAEEMGDLLCAAASKKAALPGAREEDTRNSAELIAECGLHGPPIVAGWGGLGPP